MGLCISLIWCLVNILWSHNFKNTRYGQAKKGKENHKNSCLKVLTSKNKNDIIKLHRAV